MQRRRGRGQGTIPTQAESSRRPRCRSPQVRDHPRASGGQDGSTEMVLLGHLDTMGPPPPAQKATLCRFRIPNPRGHSPRVQRANRALDHQGTNAGTIPTGPRSRARTGTTRSGPRDHPRTSREQISGPVNGSTRAGPTPRERWSKARRWPWRPPAQDHPRRCRTAMVSTAVSNPQPASWVAFSSAP